MAESPANTGTDVDGDLCARDINGGTCGQTAVVWALLDGDAWRGKAATACADHRAELLAFPGVLVSSDAPLLDDEDPR